MTRIESAIRMLLALLGGLFAYAYGREQHWSYTLALGWGSYLLIRPVLHRALTLRVPQARVTAVGAPPLSYPNTAEQHAVKYLITEHEPDRDYREGDMRVSTITTCLTLDDAEFEKQHDPVTDDPQSDEPDEWARSFFRWLVTLPAAAEAHQLHPETLQEAILSGQLLAWEYLYGSPTLLLDTEDLDRLYGSPVARYGDEVPHSMDHSNHDDDPHIACVHDADSVVVQRLIHEPIPTDFHRSTQMLNAHLKFLASQR